MRGSGLRRSWLALGCIVTSLCGCAGPSRVRYERAVEESPPEAVHGVHSDRLVELMRGLDRLRNERLPTSMDVASIETLRAEEIERVSGSLAESARAIPRAAASATLSDSDREVFLQLAGNLERAATQLRKVPAGSPEAIRAQVQEIETTCEACHRRFRIRRSPG